MGIPWDNLTDKQAIDYKEYKVGNNHIQKTIYADGSYIIKTVNLSKNTTLSPSFRSISGGNYSGGSGWRAYRNVSVEADYGGFRYVFLQTTNNILMGMLKLQMFMVRGILV